MSIRFSVASGDLTAADFQAHIEEFKKENVDILALSVDPLDKAKETVEKLQLTFAVAYGLEVPRDAEKIGAFWEERRRIIHATDFILDSDRKVVDGCYSIGPVGRIVAVEPYPIFLKTEGAAEIRNG